MTSAYPSWIDDYAKMIHKSFVNMTPADWGPVNFYDCFDALNGTFIDKLHEAVVKHKKLKTPIEELVRCFPSPSGFRADFIFTLYEYKGSDHARKEKTREITDFLLVMLKKMFVKDIWAYESNIIHTDAEIEDLVRSISWQEGDPEAARTVARLGNSGSSVSYALYRDYYVADSQEVYAPYDVSRHFGPNMTMIIKHYPKMRPIELWPQTAAFPHADMKLYLVYENVGVTCELIGMHTLYTGDVINGLRKFAAEIDGVFYSDLTEIKTKAEEIGTAVVNFWPVYEHMSKEDLKAQFLDWVCFSFAPFFKAAGMDWRPTPEMREALKGKEVRDRVVFDTFPSYEEFVQDPAWEVHWLKELYMK